MRGLLTRSRLWWLTAMSGGGVLVLGGCDPAVREQVLSGVGAAATGLATTFIEAFFQSLINQGQEETGTVVRAVLEQLPQYLA